MMDLIITYPFIVQKGGADRLLLEIAKKFDPVILTSYHKKNSSFLELEEFDIRQIKRPLFESSLFMIRDDVKRNLILSGMKYYDYKIKEDYDAICAFLPGHWIRNKNERVCWYFLGPLRTAFDLYEEKVSRLPVHKRLPMDAALSVYRHMEKQICPKIEKTVSGSPYINVRDSEFIRKYIQKPLDTIIPPAVDHKEFRNEGYGKYFFYPSRVVPEKRFEYAIDAFREFSKKENGWKLVLSGFLLDRPRERAYAEKLKERAQGLDVEFHFSPPDKELKSLYANCHAVLFCAVNEDWGFIPLEAMAAEKPCISVNEGGPVYSIIDGKTGFLVNSTEEMAQKMLYLAQHPGENEKMGKAGRKRVLENYTWDVFADRMKTAFREAAKGRDF